VKAHHVLCIVAAITLSGTAVKAMSTEDRVLDAVDQLVAARNESIAAIGRLTHVELREAGSTAYFEISAGEFPEHSPFESLEVRKPRNTAQRRGLILLGVRSKHCVSPRAIEARYGQFDDILPPIAGGPPNRPVDRVYQRPWGKLSFGFVEAQAGECLSRAVIDWTE
jgi:hypothetical protein